MSYEQEEKGKICKCRVLQTGLLRARRHGGLTSRAWRGFLSGLVGDLS